MFSRFLDDYDCNIIEPVNTVNEEQGFVRWKRVTIKCGRASLSINLFSTVLCHPNCFDVNGHKMKDVKSVPLFKGIKVKDVVRKLTSLRQASIVYMYTKRRTHSQ